MDRFYSRPSPAPFGRQQVCGTRRPSGSWQRPSNWLRRREAGERAPPFPRRIFQERRMPEGTPRTVGRPAVPGTQDEPMSTEPSRPPNQAWLAGCVVHQEPPLEAPQVEVRINGRPYQALLDSGSIVSLVQPTVLPPRVGAKARLPITCIHGDTRHVPARRVTVSAAPGSWPVEVGIVKDLPVPVLLGRDWLGFDRLLAAATQPVSPAGNRQRKKSRQRPRRCPVLLASDSARDGESPSQSTNLFYDVFQQVKGGGAFAKEQLGDERLKNCWTQVRIVEGKDTPRWRRKRWPSSGQSWSSGITSSAESSP